MISLLLSVIQGPMGWGCAVIHCGAGSSWHDVMNKAHLWIGLKTVAMPRCVCCLRVKWARCSRTVWICTWTWGLQGKVRPGVHLTTTGLDEHSLEDRASFPWPCAHLFYFTCCCILVLRIESRVLCMPSMYFIIKLHFQHLHLCLFYFIIGGEI